MRRRTVIVPLLLLAGVLLARRRRRDRAPSPLAAPHEDPPVALLEPGARFVSVPWTLVDADPAGARLRIRYESDEHMELDRVDAQETPTQVFVTVLLRRDPVAGDRLGLAQEHEAVVPLGGPLGERELVHTPVDVETPGDAVGGEPSAPPLYP